MPFTVLPYSELLHHAAFGDLQDFRKGERVIFRLHQNDEGKWVWLTYIQDEMNMLNGHGEYFYVDRIDPDKGEIEYTQGNLERTPPYTRAKNLILETDADTRFWKNGEPAKFTDIKLGDKLRAKTHGIGKGKHHRACRFFSTTPACRNSKRSSKPFIQRACWKKVGLVMSMLLGRARCS